MGTHARTAQLRLNTHPSPRLASVGWLLAGGVGIAAVALAIAATPRSAGPDAVLVRALGVAVPLGVGFARLGRRSTDRFALLLIGAGVLWSLTTLAEASDPTIYSL